MATHHDQEPVDSTPEVGRRTLVKGAAWTVPTILLATAAPAAAASTPCKTETVDINWGLATLSGSTSATSSFTRTITFNPTTTSSTFPGLTQPLTATMDHSWAGAMRGSPNFSGNGNVSTGNVGGIGQRGYTLAQQVGPTGLTAPTANDYQTVTFTFSEALTNLRFSITDIDRIWGDTGMRDFIDGVYLSSPTPYTFSVPAGSFVTGDGSTQPWQNSQNVNHNENGPGGQVDVVFPGPVTTFTIRYVNLGTGTPTVNNDQVVYVTGFRTNRPLAC